MTKITAQAVVQFVINHYYTLGDFNKSLIINYHGGEPLLEFDTIRWFTETFKTQCALRNITVKFGTTTNATLLNDRMIDYLSKNFNYSISISIDGAAKTHDRYRTRIGGQGTYHKILEVVPKFLLRRPDLRARMTFNSITVNTLFENIKHIVDLGFNTIVPIPDYFDPGWDKNHMEILYEQLEKTTQLYQSEKQKNNSLLIGMVDGFKRKEMGDCDGGITTINISSKGDIFPCTYLEGQPEFIIGHVDTGIDDYKLNNFHQPTTVKNEVCSGCTHYKRCAGGRCKALNKLLTGNYFVPSAALCGIENVQNQINRKCYVHST